jgi:hypothetical protein
VVDVTGVVDAVCVRRIAWAGGVAVKPRTRLALVFATTLACATAVTVVAVGGAGDDRTAGGWTISASGRYRTYARVNDIAAVGASDVWAVGAEGISEEPLSYGIPILAHWDGTRWTRVTPRALPLRYGEMFQISAVSAGEIWATGRLGRTAGEQNGQCVLRYDGRAWHPVPVTGLPSIGLLLPAAVRGRAWLAVAQSPSVATYTGNRWRTTSLGESVRIIAITARTRDDAWVVGDRLGRPYAAHWDGVRWTAVSPPTAARGAVLTDVHAVSATEVWATGTEYGVNRPVLLRWDGRTWQRSAVPLERGSLDAVTAAPGGGIWTAGQDLNRRDRPVLLRWESRGWTKVYGPVPSGTTYVSIGALAHADGTVWLAGSTGRGRSRWGRDLILYTGNGGGEPGTGPPGSDRGAEVIGKVSGSKPA